MADAVLNLYIKMTKFNIYKKESFKDRLIQRKEM